MKIQIYRMDEENIFTGKDFSDIRDKGEIAHVIAELECIKLELLELWEEWDNEGGGS